MFHNYKTKMSFYNKYPFKITKILDNNLIKGKVTYDKPFFRCNTKTLCY